MARRMKARVDSGHAVAGPRGLEAFVDPVQSSLDSATLEIAHEEHLTLEPHQLECDVKRKLLAQTEVVFSSLVVRRTPSGICLQGVVECGSSGIDVCSLVRQLAGVEVLSQLVMHSRAPESQLVATECVN